VDSSVAAVLLQKAIGNRFHAIMVSVLSLEKLKYIIIYFPGGQRMLEKE
jgi:GMP synthase PP-ATPase subunit